MERYLKLFTFLPLEDITLLMSYHRQDESKRTAQHLLASQIIELAHGAVEAKRAETAHKEAFFHGTATFPLGLLRKTLENIKSTETLDTPEVKKTEEMPKNKAEKLLDYKKAYAASSTAQTASTTTLEQPKSEYENVITLPITMLQPGAFPRILHAAGLASSKSEAHRLIANKGAYVVVPNSGSIESPSALKWATIEPGAALDPNHFLVDWDALVLRSGKSKVQICHVVTKEQFEAKGLTRPGWEDTKAESAEPVKHEQR